MSWLAMFGLALEMAQFTLILCTYFLNSKLGGWPLGAVFWSSMVLEAIAATVLAAAAVFLSEGDEAAAAVRGDLSLKWKRLAQLADAVIIATTVALLFLMSRWVLLVVYLFVTLVAEVACFTYDSERKKYYDRKREIFAEYAARVGS